MFLEHMHCKQINIKVESSKFKIMKKFTGFTLNIDVTGGRVSVIALKNLEIRIFRRSNF